MTDLTFAVMQAARLKSLQQGAEELKDKPSMIADRQKFRELLVCLKEMLNDPKEMLNDPLQVKLAAPFCQHFC